MTVFELHRRLTEVAGNLTTAALADARNQGKDRDNTLLYVVLPNVDIARDKLAGVLADIEDAVHL